MDKVLQEYNSELEELLEKIQKELKSNTIDFESKQEFIKDRLQRIKIVFQGYKIENKGAPLVLKKEHDANIRKKGEDINKLIIEFQWWKSNGKTETNDTTERLIQKGSEKQNKSIETLIQIQEKIHSTQSIGIGVSSKLASQSEQLKRTALEVEEGQITLKFASSRLRTYIKNIATDRITVVIVGLLVFGILFIVIWKAVHGK